MAWGNAIDTIPDIILSALVFGIVVIVFMSYPVLPIAVLDRRHPGLTPAIATVCLSLSS
ncbi:MAG: hypothetical protein NT070_15020 [Cyanobacteria bacterium]|nr:hypothetical protein [Cyanobacteriota bacterium]